MPESALHDAIVYNNSKIFYEHWREMIYRKKVLVTPMRRGGGGGRERRGSGWMVFKDRQ